MLKTIRSNRIPSEYSCICQNNKIMKKAKFYLFVCCTLLIFGCVKDPIDFVTGTFTDSQDQHVYKSGEDRDKEQYERSMHDRLGKLGSQLDELKNFILPGGSKGAALLHICRTISRRAEREVVALKNVEQIGQNIVIFLNRLSDLFFVLSRFENKYSNIPDTKWIP